MLKVEELLLKTKCDLKVEKNYSDISKIATKSRKTFAKSRGRVAKIW